MKTPTDRPSNPALFTKEGRQRAFNLRISELTRKKSDGGDDLTMDEALEKMQDNDGDRELLQAMGKSMRPIVANSTAPKRSLDTAEDRRREFNRRIDELKAKGLSFDAALHEMRSNDADRKLLIAMGGGGPATYFERAASKAS